MAFAFNQGSQGPAPSINVGSEILDINTEVIGFKALANGLEGAKKLKLVPSPWPNDGVPPASASLLAVASKRGLVAAVGPDTLVVASTDKVRKAFEGQAGDNDVVSNFTPEISLPVPQLRHVAFSADEDFLVLSSERTGGLVVYGVDDLLNGNKEPGLQISTGDIPVRSLLPNPEFHQYMAVTLDSGRLDIVDITANDKKQNVRAEGVACAAWSIKGKGLVAGFTDGTASVINTTKNEHLGTIPRPPDVDETFTLSGVFWLQNDEFFLIHYPLNAAAADEEEKEATYHIVATNKQFNGFDFHKAPYALLWPVLPGDAPSRRPPPRFSVTRFRKWEPILDDMLIVSASNSSDVAVLTKSSEKIAPDQESVNEFQKAGLVDSRGAQVPRTSFEGDGDSLTIGEALDLSSKEKVVRPAPRLEEIYESPTPLPAYYLLTHEGILAAWWVVWDKSLETGQAYHGLTYLDQKSEAAKVPAPEEPKSTLFGQRSDAQTSSPFAQAGATFGAPSTPKFGSTGFPNAPSATPAFGKSAQPAFGSTSQVGAAAGPAFGSTGLGNKPSPWGSASQTSGSQASTNPFASAAGSSGFAKFGQNISSGGSAFSSFGSANGGQSGFAGLSQQKSAFSGTANGFKGLKTEPSFGSTVTVGSGTGSTLPSWANTPAQQDSIFGHGTSSFGSTQESDMSDADDAQNRERDEATPTPQAPPPQSKGLFGLNDGGFKLGSTFKSDGTSKDNNENAAAPSGNSFFGGEFGSALAGTDTKPPTTPSKPEQEKSLQGASTTPATQPKPTSLLFPGTIPGRDTATPKAAPPKEEVVPEEAPLPPDPMAYKPPKMDEDLPPIAGSPPIKVEAPESSVPSSPLDDGDDEGDDISVEEQDEDDDDDNDDEDDKNEPSPSDAARRTQATQSGWRMADSVNQSPRFYPAAPTPPSARSGSPARPPSFGQQFKPLPGPFNQTSKASPLSFGQSATTTQPTATGGFPKPPMSFAPSSRTQEQLRSPSPVRAASTSAIGGTRREPLAAPGASLSASVQQPKPPTPQPAVSDLVDDEDERIRQELAREIEPSRTLDAFLARQEYTGAARGKTGHVAQIEIVYRDINNMVDTLGLNWRSVKAFLEYHERPQRYTELTQSDLEEVMEQGEDGPWFEKWCLAEIEDLKNLENDLEQDLDEGRVQNVLDKLSQLARLLREKARLMTKINDIRRHIINRRDPEKVEALRKASLPKELSDQQRALRTDYARLLTLLGQAEEAVMLLRSKLASQSAENGKTGAVPTVDAVKKTINKLIMITEKKNNDITLLESQLRKVGLADSSRPTSSSSRQPGTPSRRSRATRGESPYATPPTNRSKMSLSELNRRALTPEVENTPTKGYGLFFTPDGSPSGVKDLSHIADLVDDNLAGLRETARRRRKIAEGLASALVERGVKTTKVT